MALPIQLYLNAFFGQGISPHHLGIIVETSPKEALEFLGNKVWLLVFVLLTVVCWWWWSWKAARSTRDLDWADNSRWFIFGVLALGFSAWFYGEQFGVRAASVVAVSTSASAAEDSDEEDASEDSASANVAAAPVAAPVVAADGSCSGLCTAAEAAVLGPRAF